LFEGGLVSESVAVELAQIVKWLTQARLGCPETLVAAVALSAATRDAGWIRNSGWKLHRMDESARSLHAASAWSCFIRRLNLYVQHAVEHPPIGSVQVALGAFKASDHPDDRYDVVLTSPPYGDSKTTVQYGAASTICLDVVSRLPGLEHLQRPGGQIDRDCLGSRRDAEAMVLKPFWAGASGGKAAQRISSFLADYRAVCEQLQRALRPGGTIVMIVGRRSVDGYRLRLDDFTVAVMEELGLRSMDRVRRKLAGKTIRTRIRGSPPREKRVRQRNRRSLDDPRVEPEDKPCLRQAATASGRCRPSGLEMDARRLGGAR